MNAIILLQDVPGNDPRWGIFFDWLQHNWFTFLVIAAGVAAFIGIVIWLISNLKLLGVFKTSLLIFATVVLTALIVWLIGIAIAPAVGFGPKTWNRTMASIGNSPTLTVPGEAPVETPGGEQDVEGCYIISHSSGSATLRGGPSSTAQFLNEIPNGTRVEVDQPPVESNCVDGVCFRVHIKASGYPAGWIHGATLGRRCNDP